MMPLAPITSQLLCCLEPNPVLLEHVLPHIQGICHAPTCYTKYQVFNSHVVAKISIQIFLNIPEHEPVLTVTETYRGTSKPNNHFQPPNTFIEMNLLSP